MTCMPNYKKKPETLWVQCGWLWKVLHAQIYTLAPNSSYWHSPLLHTHCTKIQALFSCITIGMYNLRGIDLCIYENNPDLKSCSHKLPQVGKIFLPFKSFLLSLQSSLWNCLKKPVVLSAIFVSRVVESFVSAARLCSIRKRPHQFCARWWRRCDFSWLLKRREKNDVFLKTAAAEIKRDAFY